MNIQSYRDAIGADMLLMEEPDNGLEQTKKINPDAKVIILTTYGGVEAAVSAMEWGSANWFGGIIGDLDETDIHAATNTSVNHYIGSRQDEAMYQVISRSRSEVAYTQQIAVYRDRRSDYEIFVDDEYGQVYVGGEEADIHGLQYRILVYLMESRGALRDPIRLYLDVWEDPDGWVLAERNPKALRNRVKTRISDLRSRLDSPSIRIFYRDGRYGLFAPDGVDYCLIKEPMWGLAQ